MKRVIPRSILSKLSLWVLNVDDGALINALRNGQTVADVLKALCSSSSVSVEKVNWEFSSGRMQRSHSQSWLNETNETATWYQVQFICLLLFVRVFVCIDFLLTVLFEWDWTSLSEGFEMLSLRRHCSLWKHYNTFHYLTQNNQRSELSNEVLHSPLSQKSRELQAIKV